jgi:hypothetical protein
MRDLKLESTLGSRSNVLVADKTSWASDLKREGRVFTVYSRQEAFKQGDRLVNPDIEASI